MAELDAPKGIAASILGPPPGAEEEAAGGLDGDTEADAETTALEMCADEMIAAFETKDREALVGALRSLLMTARNGG